MLDNEKLFVDDSAPMTFRDALLDYTGHWVQLMVAGIPNVREEDGVEYAIWWGRLSVKTDCVILEETSHQKKVIRIAQVVGIIPRDNEDEFEAEWCAHFMESSASNDPQPTTTTDTDGPTPTRSSA